MKKILALVLAAIMVCVGCSTSWITQAEQIITALVPAVTNVIALVAAFGTKGVDPADLTAVQKVASEATADLELVRGLIQQYQTADAASQPAILDKIQAAIVDAQTNIAGIMSALHIKDQALQAKIQAVVGVVLAEVQSLAALVPVVKSGDAKALKAVKAPLSAKQFKKSYNSAVDKVLPGFHI